MDSIVAPAPGIENGSPAKRGSLNLRRRAGATAAAIALTMLFIAPTAWCSSPRSSPAGDEQSEPAAKRQDFEGLLFWLLRSPKDGLGVLTAIMPESWSEPGQATIEEDVFRQPPPLNFHPLPKLLDHGFKPVGMTICWTAHKMESKRIKVTGLTFKINDWKAIARIRARLPRGYKAYIYGYYLPFWSNQSCIEERVPRAIVLRDVADAEFIKARGIARNDPRLPEFFEHWQRDYGAELYECTNGSMVIHFPRFKPEQTGELMSEVLDVCPCIRGMGLEDHIKETLFRDNVVELYWD